MDTNTEWQVVGSGFLSSGTTGYTVPVTAKPGDVLVIKVNRMTGTEQLSTRVVNPTFTFIAYADPADTFGTYRSGVVQYKILTQTGNPYIEFDTAVSHRLTWSILRHPQGCSAIGITTYFFETISNSTGSPLATTRTVSLSSTPISSIFLYYGEYSVAWSSVSLAGYSLSIVGNKDWAVTPVPPSSSNAVLTSTTAQSFSNYSSQISGLGIYKVS